MANFLFILSLISWVLFNSFFLCYILLLIICLPLLFSTLTFLHKVLLKVQCYPVSWNEQSQDSLPQFLSLLFSFFLFLLEVGGDEDLTGLLFKILYHNFTFIIAIIFPKRRWFSLSISLFLSVQYLLSLDFYFFLLGS